jgi:flagellar basal body-associated protein FliL
MRRHGDRAIGIVLGVLLGVAIVIAFVFLGSGDTIDDPSLSGQQATKAQPQQQQPPAQPQGTSP